MNQTLKPMSPYVIAEEYSMQWIKENLINAINRQSNTLACELVEAMVIKYHSK
jgi:hypothetical protein